MMRDRSGDDALPITQALLAETRGFVGRPFTDAVQELEQDGLINRAGDKSRYSIEWASRRLLANVISWSARASVLTFRKHTHKKSLKCGNVHYRQPPHYEVAIGKRGKPRKLIGSVTLACLIGVHGFLSSLEGMAHTAAIWQALIA